MTGKQEQPSFGSDRDYLEMLMFKVEEMKRYGQAFYARKMKADELAYAEAKKDLIEWMRLLKKRGFNGQRFAQMPRYEQQRLL